MYERAKMVYKCFLTTVELASGLSSPIKWAMVTLLYRLGTSDNYGTSLLDRSNIQECPVLHTYVRLLQGTSNLKLLEDGELAFTCWGVPKLVR